MKFANEYQALSRVEIKMNKEKFNNALYYPERPDKDKSEYVIGLVDSMKDYADRVLGINPYGEVTKLIEVDGKACVSIMTYYDYHKNVVKEYLSQHGYELLEFSYAYEYVNELGDDYMCGDYLMISYRIAYSRWERFKHFMLWWKR